MTTITVPADISMMNISCPADSFALSGIFLPIYWLHTTAPPVASADRIWISSVLMLSTSDTPDTAASPHEETISVSNSPMLNASACSIMSGTISFFKSSLVKSNDSIFPSKKCGTASRHATNDCHSIVVCSVRIMPVQP